jgi:hypothetical protein
MNEAIKEVPAGTAELSSGDVSWVDNEEHVFLLYRTDPGPAIVRIKGQADIIKLRDLLNEAYPPGEEHGN